jgi:hypothetical protein
MLARSSGGGAGTIVVDIGGVRQASGVFGNVGQAFSALASRVGGHALPEMPPGVEGHVAAELADVSSALGEFPQPFVDIAKELRVRAFWAQIADKLVAGVDLEGAELTEFKAAYASGLLTRYADPGLADLARDYAEEVHERENPGGLAGFFDDVGDFFEGAWDAIKDPAVMLYHLTPFSEDWTDRWGDLGQGLAYGATHPLEFGKAVLNLDALEERGLAYWLGNLAPAAAATVLSGGAAAAVRGAQGTTALQRAASGARSLERAMDALPPVDEGVRVWRYHGWNEDAHGLRLVEGKTGADGVSSVPSGSGPWGHSWTHVDPRSLDNPRAALGLPTGPDGNPARFLSEGVLRNTEGIRARRALELDGQPGGWPEILVPDPESQIDLIRVEGVNPQP